MKYIGKETTCVDGAAKVTGKTKYVAEFSANNLTQPENEFVICRLRRINCYNF